MILALVTLVPVALGLSLLAFGTPGRPLLSPSPPNLVLVGAAAIGVGPVAQLALGFGGWLVLIGSLVAAALVAAGLGQPGRRTAEQR